ncbi:zinc ribbon domain-containing protein [Lentibacillus lipolyticus]|nr:zinc ribbon domain-containing protein [Lentibacillus lipolyticus]
MYCKECGTKNDLHAFYCRHDGYPLDEVIQPGQQWPSQDTSCMQCGTEKKDAGAMYCTVCGSSFDIYETAASTSDTSFNAELGKKVLPGFLLSTALLFVICQFIVIYVGSMERPGSYLQLQLPVDEAVIEMLSFLDYSLFANLTSITLTLGNDDFTQHISYFSSGLAFMAVIAMLALLPGGFLIKRLHPDITAWKAALVFAAGYAILLAVLSLLAGVDDVRGHAHYQTSFDFHVWSSVINGLFLGFIGSFAGMGLRPNRCVRNDSTVGQTVRYGIFTVMIGYVFMLVISIVLNAQYEPHLETDRASESLADEPVYASMSFVAKMGSYVFHLAMGNSFIANVPGSETVTYSFLSDEWAEKMSSIAFVIPPEFFASSEILVLILAAVFFIAAGSLLAANARDGIVRTIAVYSVIVAVLITFFAFYTSTNYSFQVDEHVNPYHEDTSVFFGFRLLRTFIISLLYAGVTAAIGALVRKSWKGVVG